MCTFTPPARLALEVGERAPGQARRFLLGAWCPGHGTAVRDTATLLLSELVTNAVSHGAAPVAVEVECTGQGSVHVRVSDGVAALPAPRDAALDEECGRGMALVGLLSAEWGVEDAAAGRVGKAVWFRLLP